MICWLVLLGGLSGVVWTAETTNDYRQPYKFVKPLTDLGDIYQRSERKTPISLKRTSPIVEKRLGFSSRMDEKRPSRMDEKRPIRMEEDNKAMSTDVSEVAPMASAMKAPPPLAESMPKAEALKSRSRKKMTSKDKKEKSEEDSSMANHRIEGEDKEEKLEAESRGGPKAEPLRQRQRYTKPEPEPEEEYEYYYDDSYYYDDEEYEEYSSDAYPPKYTSKPKYTSHSSPSSKYPNFPDGKMKAPTQKYSEPPMQKHSKPPTHKYSEPPMQKHSKPPTHKYSQPPTQKYSKPPSSKYSPSSKYNKNSSRKPSSSDYRPKPSSKSSHKSSSHNYDIDNTLQRLNALKSSHKKRKGTPYSFERYNPDTKYNNENRYTKKEPERREPTERKFKPKPAPPPKSYSDEYSEYYDDYEDYKEDPFYTQESQYRSPRPIQSRGGGGGGGANPLALLLAPLAGIALLTAAAAVAINPVLVSVSFTGRRRKRRDADELNQGLSPALEEKINEMQVLEKFMASVPDNLNYQQQVLSMYLSCSGYTEMTNHCLDRTVCEYGNAKSEVSQEERDVISIVLYNIMANQFVDDAFKDRLRLAARQGRDSQTCQMFECSALHGQFNKNELE